ncbi:MAG TPA: hypothetical protein VGO52_23670 [Hyphomonadaceae bacterium]|nr:hypothetical protein [Hyphomonadaceae bacterium]
MKRKRDVDHRQACPDKQDSFVRRNVGKRLRRPGIAYVSRQILKASAQRRRRPRRKIAKREDHGVPRNRAAITEQDASLWWIEKANRFAALPCEPSSRDERPNLVFEIRAEEPARDECIAKAATGFCDRPLELLAEVRTTCQPGFERHRRLDAEPADWNVQEMLIRTGAVGQTRAEAVAPFGDAHLQIRARCKKVQGAERATQPAAHDDDRNVRLCRGHADPFSRLRII